MQTKTIEDTEKQTGEIARKRKIEERNKEINQLVRETNLDDKVGEETREVIMDANQKYQKDLKDNALNNSKGILKGWRTIIYSLGLVSPVNIAKSTASNLERVLEQHHKIVRKSNRENTNLRKELFELEKERDRYFMMTKLVEDQKKDIISELEDYKTQKNTLDRKSPTKEVEKEKERLMDKLLANEIYLDKLNDYDIDLALKVRDVRERIMRKTAETSEHSLHRASDKKGWYNLRLARTYQPTPGKYVEGQLERADLKQRKNKVIKEHTNLVNGINEATNKLHESTRETFKDDIPCEETMLGLNSIHGREQDMKNMSDWIGKIKQEREAYILECTGHTK